MTAMFVGIKWKDMRYMYMRQSPKQYRVKHSIIAKEQRFFVVLHLEVAMGPSTKSK